MTKTLKISSSLELSKIQIVMSQAFSSFRMFLTFALFLSCAKSMSRNRIGSSPSNSRLPVPLVSFTGDFLGMVLAPAEMVPESAFPGSFTGPLGQVFSTIENTRIYYIGNRPSLAKYNSMKELPGSLVPFFELYNRMSVEGIFSSQACPSVTLPVCGGGKTYLNICVAGQAGIRQSTFGQCNSIMRAERTQEVTPIVSSPPLPLPLPIHRLPIRPPLIFERPEMPMPIPISMAPQPVINNNYYNLPTVTNINAPAYTNTDARTNTNIDATSYQNTRTPSYTSSSTLQNSYVSSPSYSLPYGYTSVGSTYGTELASRVFTTGDNTSSVLSDLPSLPSAQSIKSEAILGSSQETIVVGESNAENQTKTETKETKSPSPKKASPSKESSTKTTVTKKKETTTKK